jgi:hypothetical protein
MVWLFAKVIYLSNWSGWNLRVQKISHDTNKILLLVLHLHNLETPIKRKKNFLSYNRHLILAHTFKGMI